MLWQKLGTMQSKRHSVKIYLVNYFEETDISFLSLCAVIFPVKIHIRCIDIFFKPYIVKLK